MTLERHGEMTPSALASSRREGSLLPSERDPLSPCRRSSPPNAWNARQAQLIDFPQRLTAAAPSQSGTTTGYNGRIGYLHGRITSREKPC
jgi:hypothetical protein